MADAQFDKIVIGAGWAGLACAAELVRQGDRPLLICETNEVGAMFRVQDVGDKSRAFVQHLTWQIGWGGGWWHPLVRELNVPVRLFPPAHLAIVLKGGTADTAVQLPFASPSASAVMRVIADMGWPLDDATAKEFEEITHRALAIPYEELWAMHDVPLTKWLDEQGASELVSTFFLMLTGVVANGLSLEDAAELSVFGGIGTFRYFPGGEAILPIPYPNPREGVFIPLAQEIERRGGTIWRGRRVERVLVEGGQVCGVRLQDGTEVRAPNVAIATGNGRIKAILDPIPPEAEPALDYSSRLLRRDLAVYILLDRQVVGNEYQLTAIVDPATFGTDWFVPMHSLAPWLVEPGKQLVISWMREPTAAEVD